jgi:hypothetical protein
MQSIHKLRPYLPPAILAVSLLAVYILTMAPGLTWANDGSDGGDLIAAASTGGVAHPTGYPFYLMIARGFQFIPIGSLAYRTNLLSAIAICSAAVLVYLLVKHEHSQMAGLAAGFAFGVAPVVWSQAVITEVYGLHAFFAALLLYLTSVLGTNLRRARLDRLMGIIFGLALGNHITTILLLPLLLFSSYSYSHDNSISSPSFILWIKNWHLDLRSLLRQLAWLVLTGILVYATLPLRALFHPPINWGNPSTLNGFGWLVSGRLYQNEFLLTLPLIGQRVQAWIALLLAQFGLVGLAVGLVGLIVFFRPSPLMRNTIWTVSVFSAFAIVYGTADSYVYLIPAFLCFAIWVGIGLDGLMKAAVRRVRVGGWALGLVFIVYLFLFAIGTKPQVDASQDTRAEQFGAVVMEQAPEHAIVFAQGDEALFTLWYFHYALHQRPDLAVVSSDLLSFEWYLDTLRTTYPDLHLPGYLPWPASVMAANPNRPTCFVQYVQISDIQCSTDK